MGEPTAQKGLPLTFRLYPDTPGDVFAPSAAEGLVGIETRLQGERVTITAAEPTGDGGLLPTVARVFPPDEKGHVDA